RDNLSGWSGVFQDGQAVQVVVLAQLQRTVREVRPLQIARGVVLVVCHAALGVGHGLRAVQHIKGVGSLAAQGGHRRTVAGVVVGVADGTAIRIGARKQTAAPIVLVGGGAASIGDRGLLAGGRVGERHRGAVRECLGDHPIVGVVLIVDGVAVEVGGARDLACCIIGCGRALAKRQDGGSAVAHAVILVTRCVSVGVGLLYEVASLVVLV